MIEELSKYARELLLEIFGTDVPPDPSNLGPSSDHNLSFLNILQSSDQIG